MKQYEQVQVMWLSCKAGEHIGDIEGLTKEFNETFGEYRSSKGISRLLQRNGIKTRYFGERQRKWLMENMGSCTWEKLADRYNFIFGEKRSRSSIICACRRLRDEQRVS